MKIILNNKEETFEKESLTVSELLELSGFSYKLLIVKVNGKLIKEDGYDNTIIKDGDDVAVLHLVTGG
ncbi:MAG: sulfur carrier protein ThiS [Bacteroidales bacterium]|jgi:thiamine biosynthesis protein ThiS|nr:sulfur carrier protein ThiS [Bacteroidales bacterium]